VRGGENIKRRILATDYTDLHRSGDDKIRLIYLEEKRKINEIAKV
jgi:hypothetical protein